MKKGYLKSPFTKGIIKLPKKPKIFTMKKFTKDCDNTCKIVGRVELTRVFKFEILELLFSRWTTPFDFLKVLLLLQTFLWNLQDTWAEFGDFQKRLKQSIFLATHSEAKHLAAAPRNRLRFDDFGYHFFQTVSLFFKRQTCKQLRIFSKVCFCFGWC